MTRLLPLWSQVSPSPNLHLPRSPVCDESLSLDFAKKGSTPESAMKPAMEGELASLQRTSDTLTELITLRDATPVEVHSEFTDFIRKDATDIKEFVKLVLEECKSNAQAEAFVPILMEITDKLTALVSD